MWTADQLEAHAAIYYFITYFRAIFIHVKEFP